MEPSEILKRPYARVLTPEPDGQYTAEILEFPNCVATGANASDALAKLEEVAADWIAASLEQGQDIPEPMDNVEYSGRLVLRMPRGLHRRAALFAEREGVSLNQFIVTCLAEALGERARPSRIAQVEVLSTMRFQIIRSNATVELPPLQFPVGQIKAAPSGLEMSVLPGFAFKERKHA